MTVAVPVTALLFVERLPSVNIQETFSEAAAANLGNCVKKGLVSVTEPCPPAVAESFMVQKLARNALLMVALI